MTSTVWPLLQLLLLLVAAGHSAQGAHQQSAPRFYHTFDTLNDDVYNHTFVFAAAESCGVETDVDAISVSRFSGYSFIKTIPWRGHYRILRTQRIDAQWENNRLVMHECFKDKYDTVFVVDTFPEVSPHVIGFKSDKNALSIYNLCRRFMAGYEPGRHLVSLEKLQKNRYMMELVKDYSIHKIEFQISADTLSVIENREWTY